MGPPKKDLYEEGFHYDLLMPGPNDLPFYQRHVLIARDKDLNSPRTVLISLATEQS